MKRTLACASLLLLSLLLTACPKRQTVVNPDYDSVRQHSEESHQSLDRERGVQGP